MRQKVFDYIHNMIFKFRSAFWYKIFWYIFYAPSLWTIFSSTILNFLVWNIFVKLKISFILKSTRFVPWQFFSTTFLLWEKIEWARKNLLAICFLNIFFICWVNLLKNVSKKIYPSQKTNQLSSAAATAVN